MELPGLCEVADVDVDKVDDHAVCGHTSSLSVRTPTSPKLPGLCCWAGGPLLSGESPDLVLATALREPPQAPVTIPRSAE